MISSVREGVKCSLGGIADGASGCVDGAMGRWAGHALVSVLYGAVRGVGRCTLRMRNVDVAVQSRERVGV